MIIKLTKKWKKLITMLLVLVLTVLLLSTVGFATGTDTSGTAAQNEEGSSSSSSGLFISPGPVNGTVTYNIGLNTITLTVQSAEDGTIHSRSIVTLNNPYEAIYAIISPKDMERLINGENLEVRITVTKNKHDVPERDKALIEKGIEDFSEQIDGLTLGEYLGIAVEYCVGNEDWNNVTKTSGELELSVEKSEELRGNKLDVFYMIRAHESSTTLLYDLCENPDVITFRTDRFSTYAKAYTKSLIPVGSISLFDGTFSFMLFGPFGTPTWSIINAALCLISSYLAVDIALRLIVHNRQRGRKRAGFDNYSEYAGKQTLVLPTVIITAGFVGVFMFMLMQDFRGIMVLVDFWSILYLVILTVQFVSIGRLFRD